MSEIEDVTPHYTHWTRDMFKRRLETIQTIYDTAFESARILTTRKCDATMISMQRKLNIQVEQLIANLEAETNVEVVASREEKVRHVPFPPKVDKQQTMIEWDKSSHHPEMNTAATNWNTAADAAPAPEF